MLHRRSRRAGCGDSSDLACLAAPLRQAGRRTGCCEILRLAPEVESRCSGNYRLAQERAAAPTKSAGAKVPSISLHRGVPDTARSTRNDHHLAFEITLRIVHCFICHDVTLSANRSVKKAPIASSAFAAAVRLPMPPKNPCGIPSHTSSFASTPAATARST
jgi:hypothetical protein